MFWKQIPFCPGAHPEALQKVLRGAGGGDPPQGYSGSSPRTCHAKTRNNRKQSQIEGFRGYNPVRAVGK